MQAPVYVLNSEVKRESGRKAQLGNIEAAKSVADIIRTTLGPRSMLKMILDPMGGITMTNDGNAILREIDVSHPAAKSMIELSRTQDEEVGDGTTSVIILAGQLLEVAQPFLKQNIHPKHIVSAYYKAMDDAMEVLESLCEPVDVNNTEQMVELVNSCLGTKFVSRFGDMICRMAIEAVRTVIITSDSTNQKDIDFKRYARVERVPGGMLEDSQVLSGVCIEKDVVYAKMSRKVKNPRVVLLDCPLEYKKGESQTSVELTEDDDFEAILRAEEEYIENMCKNIIAVKPDVVLTEKGCADLAQHFLAKAGISVLRRLRKTDNNRVARATGATIVNEPALLKEADVGTKCGLFEVKKIGDEYWSFFVECREPKACTILLRGASNDVLKEISRNLDDAMSVVRNLVLDPRIVPGGGATEMAIGQALYRKSKSISGVQQFPYKAIAGAFEIIARTLIENCGGSSIKLLTELRAKHAEGKNSQWGIDGNTGELADMREAHIMDSYSVKSQTLKTAVEAACMLLRIDDIVSGLSAKQ